MITQTYDLVVDCTTCRYEKDLLEDGTCSKPECNNWALWEAKEGITDERDRTSD